jgi:undecaprenyl-diphosphatase
MDTQFISAIILGIAEGITEFLPVSSTGHLILLNEWFSFPSEDFTRMFDIMIQSGAILAVLRCFRKGLLPIYPSQRRARGWASGRVSRTQTPFPSGRLSLLA